MTHSAMRFSFIEHKWGRGEEKRKEARQRERRHGREKGEEEKEKSKVTATCCLRD